MPQKSKLFQGNLGATPLVFRLYGKKNFSRSTKPTAKTIGTATSRNVMIPMTASMLPAYTSEMSRA